MGHKILKIINIIFIDDQDFLFSKYSKMLVIIEFYRSEKFLSTEFSIIFSKIKFRKVYNFFWKSWKKKRWKKFQKYAVENFVEFTNVILFKKITAIKKCNFNQIKSNYIKKSY